MNTPHPQLEALAALAGPADAVGDISAAHSSPLEAAADSTDGLGTADILAHVASCPRCTADLQALRAVRETLRSLPPVPMPDAVAMRLEAALRTAASGAAPAHDGASDEREPADAAPAAVSVLPSRRTESDRPRSAARRLPHFSAAAAVVLLCVAVGSAVVVVVTRGHSPRHATSALSAGAQQAPVITASGTRYTEDTVRQQVAALVLTQVPGGQQRFHALANLAGGSYAFAAPSPAGSAFAAGSAPAAGGTSADAARPSTSTPAAASAGSSTSDRAAAPRRTAPSGPLADPAALQACVIALVGKAEQPVVVDYSTFNGKPATIIVLPDPSTASTLDLYVEYDSADCATKGDVSYFAPLHAAS